MAGEPPYVHGPLDSQPSRGALEYTEHLDIVECKIAVANHGSVTIALRERGDKDPVGVSITFKIAR